jgi:hypothetical protein
LFFSFIKSFFFFFLFSFFFLFCVSGWNEQHKRAFQEAQAAEQRYLALFRDIETEFHRLSTLCDAAHALAQPGSAPNFAAAASKVSAKKGEGQQPERLKERKRKKRAK